MDVLFVILSIVIFILSLGVLVLIHELGHFSMAKAFKVYVHEFSMGFGPKLFRRKKKDGETYFAIRIIPFGGYVAMLGEAEDSEELLGYQVDKKRTISGISKWKQLIIFAAGIILNFALGYILFFVDNAAFEQQDFYSPNLGIMEVIEDSPVDEAGVPNLYAINMNYYVDKIPDHNELLNNDHALAILDDNALFYSAAHPEGETVYAIFNGNLFDRFTSIDYSQSLVFARLDVGENKPQLVPLTASEIASGDSIVFTLQMFETLPRTNDEFNPENFYKFETLTDDDGNPILDPDGHEQKVPVEIESAPITLHTVPLNDSPENTTYLFESMGINAFIHRYRYNFGEAFGAAGRDWVDSTGLIFSTLGRMFAFDAEVWGQVGGPVAIFNQTYQIMRLGDIGLLFQFWGMISVNLAIMNLLPIPGLDGFQILTSLIEWIIRRELPKKVKVVLNIIGYVILLGLMFVILGFDILRSCVPALALI